MAISREELLELGKPDQEFEEVADPRTSETLRA